MLAPAIHVQQIDEVFPTLIECLQIDGDFLAGRELLVVRINLILHPAQVFDRFPFARVQCLDHSFALLIAQLTRPLLLTTVN